MALEIAGKDGRTWDKEIRGLRRCNSSDCAQVPYQKRDSIGAMNVLCCLTDERRLENLTRPTNGGRAVEGTV